MCRPIARSRAERDQLAIQHRLAAGHHDVAGVPLLDLGDDFVDRQVLAFRPPRGVRRVAEPAPQIAAAGADKHARRAREQSLALNRTVDFRDLHRSMDSPQRTQSTQREETNCRLQYENRKLFISESHLTVCISSICNLRFLILSVPSVSSVVSSFRYCFWYEKLDRSAPPRRSPSGGVGRRRSGRRRCPPRSGRSRCASGRSRRPVPCRGE